jgi:hypothetical protein
MQIEDLKAQLQAAESEVERLSHELAQAISEKKNGIHVGDTVRDADGELWTVRNIVLVSSGLDIIGYNGFHISKNGEVVKMLSPILKTPIVKLDWRVVL